MSKALAFLLSFLTTLGVAETGVRLAGSHFPSADKWPSIETEVKDLQVQNLFDQGTEVEVLLVGTSVTESGVDPSLWLSQGTTAYNAAIPYGTLVALEPWALKLAIPRLSPDVVVIGVSLWYPNPSPRDDPLRNSLVNVATRRESIADSPWPWDKSDLWLRRGQIKNLPNTLIEKAMTSVPLWTELGHQVGYAHDVVDAVEVGDRVLTGDTSYSVDALERLLSALARDGIRAVVLIEPALCAPDQGGCDQAGFEAYASALRDQAESAGAAFIDGRAFPATPEMFGDSVHFNQEGSERFSSYLLAELRALGVVNGP